MRLARRLFTLCSATSPLLCVTVCVVWIRSYRVTDEIMWTGERARLLATPAEGAVEFTLSGGTDWTEVPRGFDYDIGGNPTPRGAGAASIADAMTPIPAVGYGPFVGFQFFACGPDAPPGIRRYFRILTVPFWALSLALVLPVLARVSVGVRRARRVRDRRCTVCNYDLRATPGRCPECGAPAISSVTGPKKTDA